MGISLILHTFLLGVADLLQSGLKDLSLNQLLLCLLLALLLPLLEDRLLALGLCLGLLCQPSSQSSQLFQLAQV